MRRKNLHILYLPKEFYPNKRVRLNELFMKEFCKLGNKITWIFQSVKGDAERTIHQGNNKIIIYPKYQKNSIFGLLINRFYRLRKYGLTRKEIKKHDIDLIIAGDGLIEGFIGLRLSRKYKIPYAFYLSSLFFNFDRIAFQEEKTIKNFYKLIESYFKEQLFKYLIKRADIFHPISSAMGDYYNLSDHEKIMPLPLFPTSYFLDYEKKKDLSVESFKIISIGIIGSVRRIEFIFNIISQLKKKNPGIEIKMILIGKIVNVTYQKKLMNDIDKLKLGNTIEMIDEIPIEEIPKHLINADIGMCILPPILAYKVSSPTKLVEYMAVGLPVIGNKEIEEQKEIISKSRGGLLSSYDADDVLRKLTYAIHNRQELVEMGIRGKAWIKTNRDYSKLAEKVQNKYQLVRSYKGR